MGQAQHEIRYRREVKRHTFQVACQSERLLLPLRSFLSRRGVFLMCFRFARTESRTCSAGRRKRGQRFLSKAGQPPKPGSGRTIVLAQEALDCIVPAFDDVELERRAQEPIAHLDFAERRAREIGDTFGSNQIRLSVARIAVKKRTEKRETLLCRAGVGRCVRLVAKDLQRPVSR